MKKEKILAILPAFYEEETIAKVIAEIKKYNPGIDILVIDDGSLDNTAQKATEAGALVCSLPYNLGIGGAVQTGFKFAVDNNYQIVIQVDADGQHDPKQIPLLLEPLQKNKNLQLTVGSRFLKKNSGFQSSFSRRWGIIILAKVLTYFTGQRITDPTSGFRAIRKPALSYFAIEYPQDYPEPEALVMLHRKGWSFQEIPVVMRPRQGGKSFVSPYSAILYMVKVLLSVFINMLRSSK